ncbi:golgin subfamily A member 6-like protein 22 [Engraulis encrasicolus]|uniref:golgin subfamily A member 6-like protein 22 n=1 Tax=Engraulis encrasicolus TaxID=184585 RepID=UPI002FD5702C
MMDLMNEEIKIISRKLELDQKWENEMEERWEWSQEQVDRMVHKLQKDRIREMHRNEEKWQELYLQRERQWEERAQELRRSLLDSQEREQELWRLREEHEVARVEHEKLMRMERRDWKRLIEEREQELWRLREEHEVALEEHKRRLKMEKKASKRCIEEREQELWRLREKHEVARAEHESQLRMERKKWKRCIDEVEERARKLRQNRRGWLGDVFRTYERRAQNANEQRVVDNHQTEDESRQEVSTEIGQTAKVSKVGRKQNQKQFANTNEKQSVATVKRSRTPLRPDGQNTGHKKKPNPKSRLKSNVQKKADEAPGTAPAQQDKNEVPESKQQQRVITVKPKTPVQAYEQVELDVKQTENLEICEENAAQSSGDSASHTYEEEKEKEEEEDKEKGEEQRREQSDNKNKDPNERRKEKMDENEAREKMIVERENEKEEEGNMENEKTKKKGKMKQKEERSEQQSEKSSPAAADNRGPEVIIFKPGQKYGGGVEERNDADNRSLEDEEEKEKNKGVMGKVFGWANKKVKNYYEKKIERTHRREKEEGKRFYQPSHNAPLITRAEREQQKRHDLEKQQNKWLSVETRWNKWQTKKKEKKEAKKAKLEEKADRAWAKVLEERKQLQDLEEYHRRRYLKKNK